MHSSRRKLKGKAGEAMVQERQTEPNPDSRCLSLQAELQPCVTYVLSSIDISVNQRARRTSHLSALFGEQQFVATFRALQ
jgi:hypothetical protein